MQSASDIGVEVSKNTVNHPYMAVVMEDSAVKIFTVAERVTMDECDNFFGALQALIASYFVFNMEYPKPVRPVLIYLQFFIFSCKDDQSVPNCVHIFKSNISKL